MELQTPNRRQALLQVLALLLGADVSFDSLGLIRQQKDYGEQAIILDG